MAEQFTTVNNITSVLENLSLYICKTTNELVNQSTASSKEKINELFALDLVKMAEIHIKYITVNAMRSKIMHFKCANLRSHIGNMVSLVAITFINEYQASGYESGYFQKGTISLIDQAQKILLKAIRP